MARQRTQAGYIYQRAGWWVLRYRESVIEKGKLVRRQLAKQLQSVAPEHRRLKRPPSAIVKMAEDFLRPLNAQTHGTDGTRTIGAFVDGFYLPYVKANWRRSTHTSYTNVWGVHLEPRCGQMRLRDFRTYDGEQLLQAVAEQNDISRRTLKQVKSVLSAIFTQAKRLGHIDGVNPMQNVSIPKKAHGHDVREHGRETGVYSLEEVLKMLRVLSEPERSIVGVAAFSGLRRGEIRGLEWKHYLGMYSWWSSPSTRAILIHPSLKPHEVLYRLLGRSINCWMSIAPAQEIPRPASSSRHVMGSRYR
jgi:hypothetical protein